jgi:peptide-methionine (S)-S-oxide reductase
MKSFGHILSAAAGLLLAACASHETGPRSADASRGGVDMNVQNESIILGGGCFWCVQAAFETIPGVVATKAGYAGGSLENPSYEQVCAGGTGHIEVVKIDWDPAQADLRELLVLFWKIHDPSSLDRQGADAGYQYHSIIMWTSEAQKAVAEDSIRAVQKTMARPVVTELRKAPRFWPAEDYHQSYFRKNPDAGYCQVVIRPKLEHAGLLK